MIDDHEKIVIVGGERAGLETLSILPNRKGTTDLFIVEPDRNALIFRLGYYGMALSDDLKITLSQKILDIPSFGSIDLIVNASGNHNIHREIYALNLPETEVMTASAARLLWELMADDYLPARQSLAIQRIKPAFDEIDLANDENEFYTLLLDTLLLSIGGRSAQLYFYKGKDKGVSLEFKRDIPLNDGSKGSYNPREMKIASAVMERREPLILKRKMAGNEGNILLEDPVIAFPIISEGEVIGVIEASGTEKEGEFSDSDLVFTAQLASIAEKYFRKLFAMREVIEVSLHESLRRGLNDNLSLDIPITDRLNKCLEIIARSLNVKWYNLYIQDPDTKDLVLQVSNEIGQNMMGLIRIKDGIGIIGETARLGRSIFMKESMPFVNNNNHPKGSPGIHNLISLPLISPSGIVGVTSFVMSDPGGKKEKIFGLLDEVSRILAGSIASETERHRMSQKVMKLSVVNEEGLELLSTIDRDKVLRLATASAAMIIDAEAVILRLLEKNEEKLLVGSTYGLHNDEIDKRLVDLDARISDMVREKRDGLSISNLRETEEIVDPFPYNSVLSLPIIWEEKLIGTLSLYNKLIYNSFSCTFFTEDDKEILLKYVQYVSRALLNAQQYKDREALITIDELTGLKNERYLKLRLPEEIKRADRYHRAISLVFIEIDKFRETLKDLQETSRKDLIKRLAGIIRDNFRNVDIIVRLEEARFAVLLPDTGERVLETIQRLTKNTKSIRIKNVSTSMVTPFRLMVGYSTYPMDSPDIKTLLDNASKLLPVG